MATPSLASSDSSSVSTTYARRLVATKPSTRIILTNHFSSKVYTSSSVASGRVVIEPEYDMAFDTIQILLMGITRTETESTAGTIPRQHLFLKLQMPIPDSRLPAPRLFEKGCNYTFPFHFVIPNYLTINACSHSVNSDHVKDAHLFLPPSMGYWEKDDMAPTMANVEYSIRARILRDSTHPGNKPMKLAEAVTRINVLPASYEEAPLSICKEDSAYRMTRAKSIKKGMFSSKLGNVTLTATQPSPIFLRPDGRTASGTTARVNLRFDPVSADGLPPKVTAVTTKLVSHTYFSNDGLDKFPNVGEWNHEFGSHRRGEYYTSVGLPTPSSPPPTSWKQHITPQARRDSGYGTENTSSESDSDRDRSQSLPRRTSMTQFRSARRRSTTESSPVYHTSELNVPIALPTGKKTFIPTFHSCLSSRVYVLHMSVTVASGSSNTILSVAMPLQVAVEVTDAQQQGAMGLPTFEEALEQEEAEAADETLSPRMMRVPDVEFDLMEISELPGYDDNERYRPAAVSVH